MKKTYQPNVLKITEIYLGILEELNFFEEYEIKNIDLVQEKFSDFFTEKFIIGEDIENYHFTENEWHKILSEVIAKDVFHSLKEKGIVGSYEDDNTEEKFFLTKKGKEVYKKLKKS